MDLPSGIIFSSFFIVLILATSSMALADELLIEKTFLDVQLENDTIVPRGHIDDIEWIKRVSSEGVIEIKGISFSVINDDDESHLFQICMIIEGPIGTFTPILENPPTCISTETIDGKNKIKNQLIEFSKGIQVSDLEGISFTIQES